MGDSAPRRGPAGVGNLYDDMLAHCRPVGAVTEKARIRSVEKALRRQEHWRQRGGTA